ncbi:MAG: choice-of-anchor Q domain-containing protein, partial [Chthoniobacterales bacterium]
MKTYFRLLFLAVLLAGLHLSFAPSAAEAAGFSVTNTNDSGAGSLRQAILDANTNPGADTIDFAAILSGQTITLTSGELPITEDVTISVGSNSFPITVRRDSNAPEFRIFTITDGNNSVRRKVTLNRLIITGGMLSGGDGGGIFNSEDLTLVGCVVSGNSALVGGGIAADRYNDALSYLTLNNMTVGSNTAINIGGGISTINSITTLTDSTIAGNTSLRANGGGIYMQIGRLTVTNSTISGNNAVDSYQGSGGALILFVGTANFTNSTLSNNTAGAHGGAILLGAGQGGQVSLTNCTVFNNSAANGGGGISLGYDVGDANLHLTLTNSIIAGNSGGDVRYQSSDVKLLGRNLVQDGSVTGPNVLNVNPQLGSLQNNGGGTLTNMPAAQSPAVNAANTYLAPEFDQRGVPRPIAYEADLGAVEVGPFQLVDNIVDEDNGNYTLGDLSLREALRLAPSGGAIGFAPALLGKSIHLTRGELVVNKSLIIAAPDPGITIDGQGSSRVFNINDGNNSASSTVTLRGLVIVGGSTSGDGGGIFDAEYLQLTACTIRANTANRGGGIFVSSSAGATYTPNLIRSTINLNSAVDGAGLYTQTYFALTNSTISGNTASGDGGGLHGAFESLNSTISGNSANRGGGIYGLGDLSNTIVANSPSGRDIFATGSITPHGVNLVEDASLTGSNIINADPKLGPLQANGGATQTHALLPGSPAYNAGDNTRAIDVSANPLTTDQRGAGYPRIAAGQVDL